MPLGGLPMGYEPTARMYPTYSTAFECYEAIGRWLMLAAPEPWRQIIVEFEVGDSQSGSRVGIRYRSQSWWRQDGEFLIEDPAFIHLFFQLRRHTRSVDHAAFKSCRYVLNHDGSYKVDLLY